MNDRKCLQCFEKLRGRADQKFCSDQCRSAFNNQNYFETNTVIKSVNKILKKNHAILTMLRAKGKTSANKGELQKNGFRFDYFTYVSTSRNSKINYFCYDQGYREQDNNKLILVYRDLDDDLGTLKPESISRYNPNPIHQNLMSFSTVNAGF